MAITYKQSGVDIDAGDELVERLKPLARATDRPGVMEGLGGFGGLFDLKPCGYRDPVLVSGTDGVGTKIQVAIATGVHDTIGIDLVAMCVNDVLTAGAEPLFFLDYYACGKLRPEVGERILAGIARGCQEAGCALLGGETAEHPGAMGADDYDLAGFAVGVVERDRRMSPARVAAGDVLLGLPSTGLHSNGFSLVRHALFKVRGLTPDQHIDALGHTLGEALLTPTRIYVRSILALLRPHFDAVHGMAHITGGGLVENLPRVLPERLGMELDWGSWIEPPIFELIRAAGVPEAEMRRTFNLGIGFVLVVDPGRVDAVEAFLVGRGEAPLRIGRVTG
jgi:phosphoribosylformylglycinamidine cyclo-ligase